MSLKVALGIVALGFSSPAFAEKLTNRSVVMMSTAGLDAETIIAKIESSEADFDLSTAQLVALKKQGVPGPVIAAMLAANSGRETANPRSNPTNASAPLRPAAPSNLFASRPAGIYLLTGGQLTRIEFNVSGQTKTDGFLASALTYGIAKISTKVVLQGANARVRTNDPNPTFYFILTDGRARSTVSSFDDQNSGPSSPNDFSLIRMERKKASREARTGSANVGGVQSGVVSKDRLDFSYDEVRSGIFTVKPSKPLAPGEYTFVMIGSGGASVSKFFDFSVQ